MLFMTSLAARLHPHADRVPVGVLMTGEGARGRAGAEAAATGGGHRWRRHHHRVPGGLLMATDECHPLDEMAYENGSSRNLDYADYNASVVNDGGSALSAINAGTALVATRILPRDRHPAYVYIARLAPGSRRAMARALRWSRACSGARSMNLTGQRCGISTRGGSCPTGGSVGPGDREQDPRGPARRPAGSMEAGIDDRRGLPPCRRPARGARRAAPTRSGTEPPGIAAAVRGVCERRESEGAQGRRHHRRCVWWRAAPQRDRGARFR